jgi:lysylphosphatidylglycerol synthetase-like protein (DUF2156 family)
MPETPSLPAEVPPVDLTSVFADAERRVSSMRMSRDRSWIATTIIVTYGLAILGIILYVMFSVPTCTEDQDLVVCQAASATWDKQAGMLSDLIVTAVLPVVTLMLGFYFGTENVRNSAQE